MKIGICLHAATVVRTALSLHPSDRNLVSLGLRLGAETVVLELVGKSGVPPVAINEAIAAGATQPLRIVDEALDTADAHATGLVMERILQQVDPDLVLFSPTADPEGLADVPPASAFRRGVPCLFDVVSLSVEPMTAPQRSQQVFARVQRGDELVQLEVPRGALLGMQDPQPDHVTSHEAAAPRQTDSIIRVLTLPDLGVERVQVRRRTDLRGVIEPAARSLVTTRSVASLVSLLR